MHSLSDFGVPMNPGAHHFDKYSNPYNCTLVSVPNIDYFHKNENLENKTAKQNILTLSKTSPGFYVQVF